MNQAHIQAAYEHMDHNWAEVSRSNVVGCTMCMAQFRANQISQVYGWIEGEAFDRPLGEAEATDTARCPECKLPYVIGDASGLPVSDKQFLSAVHEHWHT